MATLTFKLDPKNVHYLIRNEGLSGGPPKPETSFFIQALPTPPSRPRDDGSEPEYSVGLMDTMGKGKDGMRDILIQGTDVFVKWGSDKDRVTKLLHEARMYTKELVGVQGSLVPRFIGTFTDRRENPNFVCLILEHLSGVIPDDAFETNRQTMILLSKLHNAGIRHKQMLPLEQYDHIVPSEKGLRVVDFTLAERHNCLGCPPLMPHDPRVHTIAYKYCFELYTLETELGVLDHLSTSPS